VKEGVHEAVTPCVSHSSSGFPKFSRHLFRIQFFRSPITSYRAPLFIYVHLSVVGRAQLGETQLFIVIFFYIRGSMYRNSRLKKSNETQQYADIYLLINYSTCFGRPSRKSSGVHKTVVAASGTDHTIWGASLLVHTRGCNYSFMYS